MTWTSENRTPLNTELFARSGRVRYSEVSLYGLWTLLFVWSPRWRSQKLWSGWYWSLTSSVAQPRRRTPCSCLCQRPTAPSCSHSLPSPHLPQTTRNRPESLTGPYWRSSTAQTTGPKAPLLYQVCYQRGSVMSDSNTDNFLSSKRNLMVISLCLFEKGSGALLDYNTQ